MTYSIKILKFILVLIFWFFSFSVNAASTTKQQAAEACNASHLDLQARYPSAYYGSCRDEPPQDKEYGAYVNSQWSSYTYYYYECRSGRVFNASIDSCFTPCPDGSPAPNDDINKCPSSTPTPTTPDSSTPTPLLTGCSDGSPAPNGDINQCPSSTTPTTSTPTPIPSTCPYGIDSDGSCIPFPKSSNPNGAGGGTGCSQPLNAGGLCDDGCPSNSTRVNADGSTTCITSPVNGTCPSGTTYRETQTYQDGHFVPGEGTCAYDPNYVAPSTDANSGTNSGPSSGTDSNSGKSSPTSGTDSDTKDSTGNTSGNTATGNTATGGSSSSTFNGTGTFNTTSITGWLKNVFDAIVYTPRYIVYKLSYWFNYGLTYITSYIKLGINSLIQTVISTVKSWITSFIESTGLLTMFTAINGNLLYLINVFRLPLILGSYISALSLRFLIRRIPFIG